MGFKILAIGLVLALPGLLWVDTRQRSLNGTWDLSGNTIRSIRSRLLHNDRIPAPPNEVFLLEPYIYKYWTPGDEYSGSRWIEHRAVRLSLVPRSQLDGLAESVDEAAQRYLKTYPPTTDPTSNIRGPIRLPTARYVQAFRRAEFARKVAYALATRLKRPVVDATEDWQL